MTTNGADPDPIESAWQALLERWDDDDAHKSFAVLAGSLDRLADAAARYREAAGMPERRDRAEAGKQLIVAQAVARIDATPRSTKESARRGRWLAPVALAGFLIAMDFLLATVTHNRRFVSVPAFALEILIVALLPWRRIVP